MWVVPLLAALISTVFAALLARRQKDRLRAPELLWAVALLMYAGASAALALGAVSGWSTAEYRTYWLLGAVLNVPFLAQGEVHLLVGNRLVTGVLFLGLLFFTAFAISVVREATIERAALAETLPSGKDVFGESALAYRLAQLYSYPAYIVLVGGTLWSAWRMRGRPELRHRFVGTLAIAGGATIVAAGAAFAAAGNLPGFALTLVVGITLMFAGFLRATRRRPS
jgi:hypothetical protein